MLFFLAVSRRCSLLCFLRLQDNLERRMHYLKLACLYVVLTPHSPEQQDLLQIILEVCRSHSNRNLRIYSLTSGNRQKKDLVDMALYKELLKLFVTKEIIHWAHVKTAYEADVRTHVYA